VIKQFEVDEYDDEINISDVNESIERYKQMHPEAEDGRFFLEANANYEGDDRMTLYVDRKETKAEEEYRLDGPNRAIKFQKARRRIQYEELKKEFEAEDDQN